MLNGIQYTVLHMYAQEKYLDNKISIQLHNFHNFDTIEQAISEASNLVNDVVLNS